MTWNSVSHLSRDEMFAEFWKVKPNRLHYGSQPGKISKHHASGARKLELGTQGQRHKIAELFRKTRHRVCHRDLYIMTCQRARLLVENDDQCFMYRVSGGKNVGALHGSKAASAFKAPSKDDQLMASIYMQALSAIVVRSEHEGRIKVKRLAQELEINLKRKEKYELGA